MATMLTHSISADQVRDEVRLICQEYQALPVGCRGSAYDLLSRAAAVAVATIENRDLAVSTNLGRFSNKRERFASEMEAILCDPGGQKSPKRLKRHAAVVSYLITVKGTPIAELPSELRKGIGSLVKEAAEAMRNRRRLRRIAAAISDRLCPIPFEVAWRMAAKPTGYRVAVVLSRGDNDEAPYELECVRFLGRRL